MPDGQASLEVGAEWGTILHLRTLSWVSEFMGRVLVQPMPTPVLPQPAM